MEIKTQKLDGSASADWESLLNQTRYPSVYQSWEWGEHKKRSGWKPERWIFKEEGERLVSLCQLLVKTSAIGLRLVWAPGGPCGFKAAEPANGCFGKSVIKAVFPVKKRTYFRCDPYRPLEAENSNPAEFFYPLKRPWFNVNSGVSVWWDLPELEKDLVGGMAKNHRYRLRQSQKAGLHWKHEKTSESIRGLVEILSELRRVKSIREIPPTVGEIETLTNDLGPKTHLVIGYLDGRPIAGVLALIQGKRAWYSYAGCIAHGREVSASYGMVFELAKALRQIGVTQLDMAGISRGKKKYAGVDDFKKGFGGRIVRLAGEFEAGGFLARLAGNLAVLLRAK